MSVDFGLLEDRVIEPEVILAPMTQDKAFGVDPRCFAENHRAGS
jgi:hypothetical protein